MGILNQDYLVDVDSKIKQVQKIIENMEYKFQLSEDEKLKLKNAKIILTTFTNVRTEVLLMQCDNFINDMLKSSLSKDIAICLGNINKYLEQVQSQHANSNYISDDIEGLKKLNETITSKLFEYTRNYTIKDDVKMKQYLDQADEFSTNVNELICDIQDSNIPIKIQEVAIKNLIVKGKDLLQNLNNVYNLITER